MDLKNRRVRLKPYPFFSLNPRAKARGNFKMIISIENNFIHCVYLIATAFKPWFV